MLRFKEVKNGAAGGQKAEGVETRSAVLSASSQVPLQILSKHQHSTANCHTFTCG